MISARTKAALAAAKARGVKLGGNNPNIAAEGPKARAASAIARKAKASARAERLAPIIEAMRADGPKTLAQIAERLNHGQIAAPRGGIWYPAQVRGVLKRL